jgi:hypothetical protein
MFPRILAGRPCIALFFAIAGITLLAPARAQEAARFHWDFGLSVYTGQKNITDALNDDATALGASFSSRGIPVGAEAMPYYLFDNGFGFGASIGPFQVLTMNDSPGASGGTSFILPVGLDVRYQFLDASGPNPYLRAGIRVPTTSGNNLQNGQTGAFGAVGLIFPRMNFGFEVGVDESKVDVVYGPFKTTVKPYAAMASAYVHF